MTQRSPQRRPVLATFSLCLALMATSAPAADAVKTLNAKDTGYRGIWYMNQPLKNEYRYKYSGGLGTYCAKHRPFAVYCDQVKKPFFCYGGTSEGSHSQHDLPSISDGSCAGAAFRIWFSTPRCW